MSLKDVVRIAQENRRLTAGINRYLLTGRGQDVDEDTLLQLVYPLVMMQPGDDPSRDGEFHSSSLSQCPRRQVFGFWGAPTEPLDADARLSNIFNDGHWRHARWQTILYRSGGITHAEVPIAIPELRFKGRADGIHAEERYLVEIKGIYSTKKIREEGPLPSHIVQVHAYMLALGYEEAAILYEDKGTQLFEEVEVHADDQMMDDIENRLVELNQYVDERILPPILSDCRRQEGAEYNSCPYAHYCLRVKVLEQVVQVGD